MGPKQSSQSFLKSLTQVTTKNLTELFSQKTTNVQTQVITNLKIKVVVGGDLKQGSSLNLKNETRGRVSIVSNIQRDLKTEVDTTIQNSIKNAFNQENKVVNDIFSTLLGNGETKNVVDIQTYVDQLISTKISKLNYDEICSGFKSNAEISLEVKGSVYDSIDISQLSGFDFQAMSIVNEVEKILIKDKVLQNLASEVDQKNDTQSNLFGIGGDLKKWLIIAAVLVVVAGVLYFWWKSQQNKSSSSPNSTSSPVYINNATPPSYAPSSS